MPFQVFSCLNKNIFKNSNYAIKSHYSSHMKLWRAASPGPVSWLLMKIGLDIDLWPVRSDLNKWSLFWAHAEDNCSRMNEYPLIPQHGMKKWKENEAGSHVRLRKTWFYSTREKKHMTETFRTGQKQLRPTKSSRDFWTVRHKEEFLV